MFSKSSQEDPNLYTLIDSQGDIYLYECKYTLPLGFMVNNHPGFNISSGDSQTASGEVGEGGSQERKRKTQGHWMNFLETLKTRRPMSWKRYWIAKAAIR